MKKTKKKGHVKVFFKRSIDGYWCMPSSVIAWLYSKGWNEVAEDFGRCFDSVTDKIEKDYQKEIKK